MNKNWMNFDYVLLVENIMLFNITEYFICDIFDFI